jgi:hypothetical protein
VEDRTAVHCSFVVEVTMVVVVVVVVVVAVARAGHVVPSMRFLSWLIEQEANEICTYQIHHSELVHESSSTHHILLDAIGDALDNVLHYGTMVALWLVITKAHHAPTFADRIPAHFDNPVIDLFTTGFQTGKWKHSHSSRHGKRNFLLAARDVPLPLVVTYTHCVPGFIISFRTLAPTPNVKSKNGLSVEVWLGW